MPEPAVAAAFDAALAELGPFERPPQLAIAVSGGADSLSVALLAADWAARRGGAVTALTVDHGLRPTSADEAAAVGATLEARGIAHRVLRWTGAKPARGIQARARAARYRLLEDWTAQHGVLHLLTGHTADDQAETLLLRLRRGSRLSGLAGMSAVVERPWGRILRPALALRHDQLCGWLVNQGIGWIEDPSNTDPRFTRSALRREIRAAGASSRLAGLARRLGALRQRDDRLVVRHLARLARAAHEGFDVDPGLLRQPDAVAVPVLARLCWAAGGAPWPPADAALRRALARLRAGTASTLGGCRLIPLDRRLRVVREWRPQAMTARESVAVPPQTLGPAVFQLVSPPRGPIYPGTDSDFQGGPCMLGAPPRAAHFRAGGEQRKG